MAFTKILDSDVADKGVIGLPDTPNLSTQAMQEKFDEIALDVLKPKHNELIDELEAGTAAASIGAIKNGEATTVQDMLDDMSAQGYTKEETDVLLSGKVDKEVGKGLSTYDFSEGYKDKLNNIEDNANNYVLPPATQSTLGGVMGDGETFTVDENGVGHAVGGGGGGTADYDALINKPKINDLALIGDKTSEDYGILRPYIKVTSDAGSTVTIKKGTEEITLTQVSGSSTEWEGHPTAYGTWTVKSVLAGADDATTTVTVDAVKTYAVTVSHISATITVTYPAGATYCKLSKGTLEYTATQNPQTFIVRSIGTWNIEVEYNGVVKTATAIISADGDSQSVTIEYASITVNYGNDFKGKTITCTDGLLTYTKVAPNDASSISFTIPNTGTWTVSATVSGVPYSVNQTVSSYTTYTVTLEVFNATVTITFPYSNGATCTITDGDTTLTATESPMAFGIPNTGTWTATCTLDGVAKTQSFVITTDGQTESHTFEYGTINLTYANEFRGLTISCVNGGTTIQKTAPVGVNSMAFYPPNTGTWTISGTYSGVPYTTTATVSSLSTAVSAVLQTNISATVTLHGAAGATITWTDANGTSQTATLDNNGEKANVTVTAKNSYPIVVFEDTNVSKNPVDLTANYKKSLVLKDSLTDIYVMPSNNLYWYGNKGSDYEVASTANGWTAGGTRTFVNPTEGQTSLSLTTTASTECAIGSVSAKSTNKVSGIVATTAQQASTGARVGGNTTKIVGSTYASQSTLNTTEYISQTLTGSNYPFIWFSSGRSGTINALWYNTANDYNFYSAANDVVTTKVGGVDVIFAITDENGGAYIDYTALPSGSYTLTSSVAKNPSDLTADYSKTVSVSSGTTEVKVMPDGAIYWYGYGTSDFGNTIYMGPNSGMWTFNTQDMSASVVSAGTGYQSSTLNKVNSTGTIKIYSDKNGVQSKTISSGEVYIGLRIFRGSATACGLQLLWNTSAGETSNYSNVHEYTGTSYSATVYAVWFE